MTPFTPTEEMLDALREGRFHTAPPVQHIIGMHLLALEWAEEALLERWAGYRGPREVAAEAIARNRHAALIRSYGRPEPRAALGRLVGVERRAA